MNKRDQNWRAFNERWFESHQRGMLTLLNTPLLGWWFRWCLRIRSTDDGYRRKILWIKPNCYAVSHAPGTVTVDFRPHPKFSKRVYFAFRPLWWMLHYWDELFAERWFPRWAFGFSTLTAFPDANPETATVDGTVIRDGVSEDWSDIRIGSGTDNDDANELVCAFTSDTGTTDFWIELSRIITLFDISALPVGAGVSSVVLSLFGLTGKADPGNNDPSYCIYSALVSINTNLLNTDFEACGSTEFSDVRGFSSWANAYNPFTFNAAGLATITPGIVQYSLREKTFDVDGGTPSWTSSALSTGIAANSAENVGTTQDPKLVITYSVAVTGTANGAMVLAGRCSGAEVNQGVANGKMILSGRADGSAATIVSGSCVTSMTLSGFFNGSSTVAARSSMRMAGVATGLTFAFGSAASSMILGGRCAGATIPTVPGTAATTVERKGNVTKVGA